MTISLTAAWILRAQLIAEAKDTLSLRHDDMMRYIALRKQADDQWEEALAEHGRRIELRIWGGDQRLDDGQVFVAIDDPYRLVTQLTLAAERLANEH